MDEIKPVAWVCDSDFFTDQQMAQVHRHFRLRKGFSAELLPLYDQQAIDTLRAEVERLTKANIAYAGQNALLQARAERAEADANNHRAEVEQLTSEFLDLQREMNLWQDEALSLRKLCLEAVGRVSVLPDGGDLHDRLVAATVKDEW